MWPKTQINGLLKNVSDNFYLTMQVLFSPFFFFGRIYYICESTGKFTLIIYYEWHLIPHKLCKQKKIYFSHHITQLSKGIQLVINRQKPHFIYTRYKIRNSLYGKIRFNKCRNGIQKKKYIRFGIIKLSQLINIPYINEIARKIKICLKMDK